MKSFNKLVKPISKFMVIVMLLAATSWQSVSAAMIRTETLIQAGSQTHSPHDLRRSTAREQIRQALVVQGVDPREAALRMASLTDEELAHIAANIDTLRAGRGVVIFSMIILGVIVATVIVFNFTNVTDVFP